jgi:peptidoglycan hydrolase-like protein with peptidoglycan-binding domain
VTEVDNNVPMRSRHRGVGAVLTAFVVLTSVSAPAATADTPPVAFPSNPTGLQPPVTQPSGVESFSPYLGQVSCDPTPQPGVRRLRDLALSTYGRGSDGGMARSCVRGGQSEHKEGRAWDWMLDVGNAGDRAAAADFLAWLTRRGPDSLPGLQARRLGVMYVIFNRRIWSAYRASEGWRIYSGSSPHTDHIHLSFSWAGARGATSFWSGRVAAVDYGRCAVFSGQPAQLTTAPRPAPCSTPVALVKRSSFGIELLGSADTSSLLAAQARLGVAQSGRFDNTTWSAVKSYQSSHDLPSTGALDQPTWSSLRPRSVTWNVTAGYTPAESADYAAARYSDLRLRRGSAGAPVIFLQKALRMRDADRNGFFRARTADAVRSFKVAHGLADNAVVNRNTWLALAAAS